MSQAPCPGDQSVPVPAEGGSFFGRASFRGASWALTGDSLAKQKVLGTGQAPASGSHSRGGSTPSETPVLLVENTDSRAPPPTYRLIFIFSSRGPGICIQPTSQCPKTRRRLPTTPLPFTNHTVAF